MPIPARDTASSPPLSNHSVYLPIAYTVHAETLAVFDLACRLAYERPSLPEELTAYVDVHERVIKQIIA